MTRTHTVDPHHYRRWTGSLSRERWTWLAIVANGVRLALKRSRDRTLTMMSLGFIVAAGSMLYVIALLETLVGTDAARGMLDFIHTFLRVDLSDVQRIAEFREQLWRSVFLLMIQGQLLWVVIVVARVGPRLIADDIRARSLPIYFAKPITPITYVAGKWLVVATFIGLVTLVPNLLALVLGIALTGGLETIGQNLHLGLDLLISGVGLMVFAGMLMLALSSLTSDRRYVTAGWLAICLLPMFAQGILDDTLPPDQTTGLLGSVALNRDIVVLHERLFGLREAWEATALPEGVFDEALVKPVEPIYPALVLGALTVASVLVCYRRVVRFSQTAANV